MVSNLDEIKVPLSNDGIFYTVQGEGKNTGQLSIFIRLSYCNLHCSFCDSFYTWKSEYVNSIEKPNWVSLDYILQEIKKYSLCKHIVFTGGEPLLFQNKLLRLFQVLNKEGYTIEIETNGTIIPFFVTSLYCSFNISPKLSNNTTDTRKKRICFEALQSLNHTFSHIFKFVVNNKDDWEEIEKDFIIPFNIPLNKIYLMPEGQTREELELRRQNIVNLCLEKGVNYSDRLQTVIWDKKRGV